MKSVIGTSSYMAPELRNEINYQDSKKYKENITDAYSLGIILL